MVNYENWKISAVGKTLRFAGFKETTMRTVFKQEKEFFGIDKPKEKTPEKKVVASKKKK